MTKAQKNADNTNSENDDPQPPAAAEQQSAQGEEQSTTTITTTTARRTLPRHVQERNRAVAEREASRLARPDRPSTSKPLGHASKQKSAVSSTPFGFDAFAAQKQSRRTTTTTTTAEEENDSWCGPFSVARQMIASREDARRKREEESEEKNSNENGGEHHPLDAMLVEAELNKKRKANPS